MTVLGCRLGVPKPIRLHCHPSWLHGQPRPLQLVLAMNVGTEHDLRLLCPLRLHSNNILWRRRVLHLPSTFITLSVCVQITMVVWMFTTVQLYTSWRLFTPLKSMFSMSGKMYMFCYVEVRTITLCEDVEDVEWKVVCYRLACWHQVSTAAEGFSCHQGESAQRKCEQKSIFQWWMHIIGSQCDCCAHKVLNTAWKWGSYVSTSHSLRSDQLINRNRRQVI